MFLSKNRRTRVVAVGLLAALLVPLATASADYWDGKRVDNTPTGGYYIFSTVGNVDGVDYEAVFRYAAGRWANGSVILTQYVRERGSSSKGFDKYLTEPGFTLKAASLKGPYGRTRIYGPTGGNPVTQDLEAYYPDYPKGINGPKKHGDGCGHDKNWEVATVTLYTNTIRDKADAYARADPNITRLRVAQSTAVHEIGHTLKIAHSQLYNGEGGGGGTIGKNVPYTTSEGNSSVMRIGDNYPFPNDLQSYDKRQRRSKWGL